MDSNSRCSRCGGILGAEYDVGGSFPKELAKRSIWDFAEFFPPVSKESIVSMGEGWTPYVETPRLATKLGLKSLRCKVEGCNPTGSFKDRAASIGISLAKEWGNRGIFTASDGNAGASVSAYSARANIACLVLVDETVPFSKLGQIMMYSPKVLRYSRLYESSSNLESAFSELHGALSGWRNMFVWAPYNPLIVDGLKTMAYEIALSGDLPDFVFVPTAGGDLLSGLRKGFEELRKMGEIDRIPRLVAVQGEGADATVRAIEQGLEKVKEGGPPRTIASALRVNFGAEHTLAAVRETGGFGIAVPDALIEDAQRLIAREEGIFCEVSSATAVAAIGKARQIGKIAADQSAAAILTGFGLKEYVRASGDTARIPTVTSGSQLRAGLSALLGPDFQTAGRSRIASLAST